MSALSHYVFFTLPLVMYEVKCLTDDVMNTTENLTDGIVNGLFSSQYSGLLSSFTSLLCSANLKVAGLCL